jgi:hypothetical protein
MRIDKTLCYANGMVSVVTSGSPRQCLDRNEQVWH